MDVHQLLYGVIDNLPDCIFIKDVEGRFLLNNAAHIRVLGASNRDEVVGKTDFEYFDPALAEQYSADDREVLRNGHTLPGREEVCVGADRTERWLLTTKVPIRNDRGTVVALVGIARDITERRAGEEAIRRSRDKLASLNRDLQTTAVELARSNAELEQFAYVASHDLQEPLRKIQAFGGRLATKFGDALSDQGKDYLERIQNSSARMQTLISDLLTVSRVTTQSDPFIPVDLTPVVKEVVADLEIRIEELGAHVNVGALPTIDADPTQMRQLFQNLIGNALKFHRDSVAPEVKLDAHSLNGRQHLTKNSPNGESCRIIVEDNGIGFDQQYAERIFEVFQRLHGRGEYEGTGVGLAMCRKIVERHGGTITASSKSGPGAMFVVTLPLKQPGVEHSP